MDCTLCQIIVTFQRKTFRKNIKTIKTIYENIRYEKLQNHHCHQVKLRNMNIFQVNKYRLLIKVQL